MPSRPSVLGIAFSTFAFIVAVAPPLAHAAPKAKTAKAAKPVAAPAASAVDPKKKQLEINADEKALNKQMSWEDKVMGSNAAKKAELAKIARAQAITKAAEADAAKAAASAPPPVAAAPSKQTKNTVSVPSVADNIGKGPTKASEIPSTVSITDGANTPAPSRTEDKFIDKIMTTDGKKRPAAKTGNDSELEQLLAKEAEKPGAKRPTKAGRKDSVNELLEAAKNPDAVVSKPTTTSTKTADWEKLEAPAMPAPMAQPAPVMAKKVVKQDDGVIRVVQGANFSGATASRPAAPPPRAEPVPAAKAPGWKDPFSDSARRAAPAPTPAPAPVKVATRSEPAPAPVAATKKDAPAPGGPGWKDPFADSGDHGNKGRHGTAAAVETKAEAPKKKPVETPRPGTWKDPFSDSGNDSKRVPGVEPHSRELATSTPAAVEADGPESKWKVAARRPAAKATPVDGRSRWSVLKRR